jgi:D-alanyl-D-alanine carboxypeptidase
LYGLLLPSGNDAAHCLAEYFGGLLKKDAEEQEAKTAKLEREAREARFSEEEARQEQKKEEGMESI